ncbi:hypothetical protein TNIN_105851 [Trichonephila inaurata madagascariensis]|uniref:Uncharacterized protein n=1 Tax=Trichonephila inaurata madagascariensis TaxID=2747483 RepID=A0A8X7C886_9ARAC|nr:hypothetical protein TNIN_105851 [Trichonephila inaurata madagascariensis]
MPFYFITIITLSLPIHTHRTKLDNKSLKQTKDTFNVSPQLHSATSNQKNSIQSSRVVYEEKNFFQQRGRHRDDENHQQPHHLLEKTLRGIFILLTDRFYPGVIPTCDGKLVFDETLLSKVMLALMVMDL